MNNPVNMEDPTGNIAWWIIGGISGAVVGGISRVIYSYKKTGLVDWRYVVGGASAGGLVGAGLGYLAQGAYIAIVGTTATAGSVSATNAINKVSSNGVGKPEIGRKLEYVFGNATGSKHNIDRSIYMANKLNKIGILDNAKGRAFMQNELQKAFNNTTNGILQNNGRIMKEFLLTGPNGFVKMQSVWDGNRLITVEIFKSDWRSFMK